MGHDFFKGFSNRRGFFDIEEMRKKDEKSGSGKNSKISEAEGLGIHGEGKYWITDEDGKITITDPRGLQEAIEQAKATGNADKTQTDEFISSTKKEDENLSINDKKKANTLKEDIEAKIAETETQYYKLLNQNADSTTEEGKIEHAWTDTEDESLKFIGVDASNTTVLEGAKEFISKICGIVNDVETNETDKQKQDEAALYSDSNKSIEDTSNRVQVYNLFAEDDRNMFGKKYMDSAMNTFNADSDNKRGRREFVA